MTKPGLLILVLCAFLVSCQALKPLQSPAKSSNPDKTTSPFIESIEVTPGTSGRSTGQNEDKLPALEDNYRPAMNFNTGLTIDQATIAQFRYSILLNTEVEYLANRDLYRLISDWWGTPYKIGGMTPRGIDCSAFVQNIMAGAYQLAVPRTAKEQKDICAALERTELREGDLVFFNTRGGVSHVGIYLHNNKFVHASTSGGVMISDLSEPYWEKRYLGAGRPR